MNIGGNVFGNCGRSQGLLVVDGHHAGPFTTAASIVVIGPGEVVGLAEAVPATGQSCLPPGAATQFQVTGFIVVAPPSGQ